MAKGYPYQIWNSKAKSYALEMMLPQMVGWLDERGIEGRWTEYTPSPTPPSLSGRDIASSNVHPYSNICIAVLYAFPWYISLGCDVRWIYCDQQILHTKLKVLCRRFPSDWRAVTLKKKIWTCCVSLHESCGNQLSFHPWKVSTGYFTGKINVASLLPGL